MTFQLNDVDFFFKYYTIYHIVSMLFFEIKMQFSFFSFSFIICAERAAECCITIQPPQNTKPTLTRIYIYKIDTEWRQTSRWYVGIRARVPATNTLTNTNTMAATPVHVYSNDLVSRHWPVSAVLHYFALCILRALFVFDRKSRKYL